ncbi:hypothetical protein D3C71_1648800 [compost metagenome]
MKWLRVLSPGAFSANALCVGPGAPAGCFYGPPETAVANFIHPFIAVCLQPVLSPFARTEGRRVPPIHRAPTTHRK